MQDKITMVPFSDEYARHFTELNKAWLEKYFEVEPIDEKMLANPRQYFIDKGGFIFFALYNNEVAGTFALLKLSDHVVELSKMAVYEKFQGKGVGNKMIEFCLQEAKRIHLEKVILYSNTLLGNAIHLYKKYGFAEVKDFKCDYRRCNIKMELVIK
jgi:N-acetylglutamate synthase-like GNAT family acetyltransferase